MSGRVVSRGFIRVDARKAMERLRSHLLIDLNLYTLEAARFAVAAGATRIDATASRDRVELTWDGEPLPPEALGRLLDILLSGATDPESRKTRLLALAVNAALGLEPVQVAVTSSNGQRSVRALWTPEAMENAEEARLEEVAAERPGMRLQVQRRLGWRERLLPGAPELPRELELLGAASSILGPMLTLGGGAFPRPARAPALLRVPVQTATAAAGWLEIVDGAPDAPVIEMHERRLLMTSYRWSPQPPFPQGPYFGCALPVRIVIDAPQLDTNASRSAVRDDSPLWTELGSATQTAFQQAIDLLAARVAGTAVAEPAPGEFCTDDPVALENVLGAILCVVAGARSEGTIDRSLDSLFRIPVFRDAAGVPRTVGDVLHEERPTIPIWRGEAPVAEHLAPWLAGTVWLRGRTAEKLLGGFDLSDAEPLVVRAEAAYKRRERFLATPPCSDLLQVDERHLARQSFEVTEEGPWQGLRGVVALLRPSPAAGSAMIHMLVLGRGLQTVVLPAETCPLRLEAAVQWEGHIEPRFDWDSVQETNDSRGAAWVAIMEAVRMAEPLSAELPAAPPERAEAVRELLRAAAGALVRCGERLGIGGKVLEPRIAGMPGLWDTPLWPLSTGRLATTSELAAFADRTGALCTVRQGVRGQSADQRPVLAGSEAQQTCLVQALGGSVRIVPYGRGLLTVDEPQQRARLRLARLEDNLARALGGAKATVTMRYESGPVLALVAVSDRPAIVRCHAGQVIGPTESRCALGPVAFAVDDDSIVPDPAWQSVLSPRPEHSTEGEIQWEFLEAVVSGLEGTPTAPVQGLPALAHQVSCDLLAWLLLSLAAVRKINHPSAPHLASRIEALPLLRTFDPQGAVAAVSLSGVLSCHGPRVPVLTQSPSGPLGDWRPLLLPPEPARTPLLGVLGSDVVFADGMLAEREELARQESALDARLQGPVLDPDVVEGALPGQPLVRSTTRRGSSEPISTVAAGLSSGPPARVRVLFRRRLVANLVWADWPVDIAATVCLNDRATMADPMRLNVSGMNAVVALCTHAVSLLALELVERAHGQAKGAALFEEPRVIEIVAFAAANASVSDADLTIRLLNRLRDAQLLWPTAQGGWAPLERMRREQDALFVSSVAFPSWMAASGTVTEFDSPIALASPDALRRLLQATHGQLRDVTTLLASLQAMRTGQTEDAPLLPGLPAHPALRSSLAGLEIHGCQGELELAPGPASEVTLIGLDGAAKQVPAALPVPVRAIVRVEAVVSEELSRKVLAELTRAGARLLRSLTDRFDELPVWVRGLMRRLVCVGLARKGHPPKRDLAARVFVDTRGAWRSALELIGSSGAWAYTLDPPPYPAKQAAAVVLCLSAEEAAAVAKRAAVKNETDQLRRALQTEQRMRAVPLDYLALDAAARARCLHTFRLRGPELEGEVGLLAPEAVDARGIRVHLGRRPLCVIADGPGWPLCAVVNDDRLKPNEFFDGLESGEERTHVNERVRAAADEALSRWPAAPAGAAAVRRIHQLVCDNKADPFPAMVTGIVWVPSLWQRSPQAAIRGREAHEEPGAKRATRIPNAEPIVPVCYELTISTAPRAKQALTSLGLWSLERSAAMRVVDDCMLELIEQAAATLAPAELDAFRWELALIGRGSGALQAPCVDGTMIREKELLRVLETGLPVHVASRVDAISLQLDPPVLLDDGGACLRVLRARAASSLRMADDDAGHARDQTSLQWLGRILDELSGALTPEHEAGAAERAVADALHQALSGLRLSGDPVREVRLVRRGRPVRFRPSDGSVLLNHHHPSLALCFAEQTEGSMTRLLAAAVTEINRELSAVTDAEERRVLEGLLGGIGHVADEQKRAG